MRYHAIEPDFDIPVFGEVYICAHPVYDRCLLFREKGKGLAVIQQYYDPFSKRTWWAEPERWVGNAIYLSSGFSGYFAERAGAPKNGLYPTVTVRQIMWALRLKPLPKERWETVFDRREI